MDVTYLPSSAGSAGPLAFLSSYVVNDRVAIDAGSLGFWHDVPAQLRVEHVFISHSHLDHLASLAAFLENIFMGQGKTPTVYGSSHVIECLRRDYFNNRVWPDLLSLRDVTPTPLHVVEIEPGEPVEVGDLRVTPIAVDHVVPTTAFLVEEPGAAVVFSADTGPTTSLWEHANRCDQLRGVFIDSAFPNAEQAFADLSQHLTPATVAQELTKLDRKDVRCLAVHLKPAYLEQIIADLNELTDPRIEVGEPGVTYSF
ncbi:MAG: 3',5'-cyclic-nucleotide phosphodiesterase [Planctomycetota bacterium]